MELKKSENEEPQQGFLDTKKLITEFLGIFALTYIGSWCIVYKDMNEITNMAVSFVHGLTITVFTWITLDVSGSHFNPAITLAMIINNKIEWSLGMFYIITHFLGGIVGAGFIYIQMTDNMMTMVEEKSIIGIPKPGSPHYDISGFWAELFGTFFLTYVFMAMNIHLTKKKNQDWFPMGIGLMYYVCRLTLGEVSGGAFNPARAMGPAIMAGSIGSVQMNQVFGSFIGGILGAVFYSSIYMDEREEDDDDEDFQDENAMKESEMKEYIMPTENSKNEIEMK